MKRNHRTLCLSCYGELDYRRVCKNCGKEEELNPSPLHQLSQRTVLNKKYLICRTIGEGGFGITYLAYDLVFNRPVAIKEYYPSGAVSRDAQSDAVILNLKENQKAFNRGLRRCIEEAKNLASLKNLEGIVRVLDFFAENNTAYMVMEYLDGISLKKYVQRKGKLSLETALTILHPVVSSLACVHDAGMIHRDISPDNILITRKGEVKLIDFGASKQNVDDGRSLSIVLKQGFAPEEQYRTHGEQGPWSDVYALSVTIYFCITGQLPPESIQRLYEDTLTPPSALGVSIKAYQEKALLKGMAVLAKNRFRSVKDMERDLYNPPHKREPKRKTVTLAPSDDGQAAPHPTQEANGQERTTPPNATPANEWVVSDYRSKNGQTAVSVPKNDKKEGDVDLAELLQPVSPEVTGANGDKKKFSLKKWLFGDLADD